MWMCLNINDSQLHGFPFKWFISKHFQSIPVFQVDAKVFYAEAGLEIRGEWRTADGTTGTLSGTKALAGLALGGSNLSGKLFPDADETQGKQTWEIVMLFA